MAAASVKRSISIADEAPLKTYGCPHSHFHKRLIVHFRNTDYDFFVSTVWTIKVHLTR